MAEESIYNLIPKEYVPPPKQPLYKSKYSYKIPPTASTFGHHTTSVPGISNVAGLTNPVPEVHPRASAGATFGKPIGTLKPDPHTYSKRGTGKVTSTYNYSDRGSGSLSPSKKEKTVRFPPIPKKDEKPIYGLKTNKNFVVANAVEAMLAQPKVEDGPLDFTKKSDFGKVPKYLNEIKEQMQREYEHIRAIHDQEEKEQEKDKFVLSEEEIQILREGLKAKWEQVNKEYQKITHLSKLDTIGKKRRKEGCEKELAQLEKDLEKLNKAFVVVDTTQ